MEAGGDPGLTGQADEVRRRPAPEVAVPGAGADLVAEEAAARGGSPGCCLYGAGVEQGDDLLPRGQAGQEPRQQGGLPRAPLPGSGQEGGAGADQGGQFSRHLRAQGARFDEVHQGECPASPLVQLFDEVPVPRRHVLVLPSGGPATRTRRRPGCAGFAAR